MTTQRKAKLTIVLGTNGTGKTTLINTILQRSNQRALIITPDNAEWLQYPQTDLSKVAEFDFAGIKRHVFNPYGNSLEKINYYTNGILIFDDCRSYLKAATDEVIHNILIRRRQKKIDVFAVGHGFTEVPPVFFTFCSDFFLFQTTDNIVRRKDCLKEFERMKTTQERINKKAVENPHYFEHIKFS